MSRDILYMFFFYLLLFFCTCRNCEEVLTPFSYLHLFVLENGSDNKKRRTRNFAAVLLLQKRTTRTKMTKFVTALWQKQWHHCDEFFEIENFSKIVVTSLWRQHCVSCDVIVTYHWRQSWRNSDELFRENYWVRFSKNY
jgi:hypothetical protein